MERVRRCVGHCLPEGPTLSGPPPLTPDRVRAWGRYAETSPLYQHLNNLIAADEQLLVVLNAIERTPRQNILLAGVQYLMMRDGGGGLAPYYANLTDDPLEISDVDLPFTEFVLGHADELIDLGRTRYTQTNECRRCVALLAGIWATGAERFHLIDFGTSAGLNLHLDRYHYRWGDVTWGPESRVHLVTENRGAPVTPRNIEILSRTGLDLDPIDPADPDDRRWLEAFIWPEHHDRRRRLRAALDIAAANPVDLVTGDALTTLGQVLDGLPGDDPAVVLNSFILNQLQSADRERFDAILNRARDDRAVYRVSMEWLDIEADGSDLAIDDGSGLRNIGSAQPHGEWLELYARP